MLLHITCFYDDQFPAAAKLGAHGQTGTQVFEQQFDSEKITISHICSAVNGNRKIIKKTNDLS
jgi:hypothetical protein